MSTHITIMPRGYCGEYIEVTVGLRIFNDNGISQISDRHHNFVLVGKGTVSGDGDTNVIGREVYFSHSNPVMFAASAPSGATVIVNDKNGTSYKIIVLFHSPHETVTWYAFSYPKNLSSGLGLQVFNEAGSLTYDSAQKPIRLAYFSAIDIPDVPPPAGNHHNFPQYPTLPSDIVISQPRRNRTYASLSVNMLPFRVATKIPWGSGWLIGWGLCYYMPAHHADGIRLTVGNSYTLFTPSQDKWPGAILPYGGDGLSQGGQGLYQGLNGKQLSWIIDVTGY